MPAPFERGDAWVSSTATPVSTVVTPGTPGTLVTRAVLVTQRR